MIRLDNLFFFFSLILKDYIGGKKIDVKKIENKNS